MALPDISLKLKIGSDIDDQQQSILILNEFLKAKFVGPIEPARIDGKIGFTLKSHIIFPGYRQL